MEKEESLAMQKEDKLYQQKQKQAKLEIKNLIEQPFEDFISVIHNEPKWTAAFTITKVMNKPTRTLMDTGASHSVVSFNWVQQLKLEKFIQPIDVHMVDAQKREIPVNGKITLTVEFGGKDFEWTVRVAPNMICPLIIGIDILHKGAISLVNRWVEIGNYRQPITITLSELQQATVMAAVNTVIQPYSYKEIKGKLIKDNLNEIENLEPQNYILNAGGIVTVNQLVTSEKCKAQGAQHINEYVPVKLFNKTNKKMCIKKGTVMATAEHVSNDVLNCMTEFTLDKAINNWNMIASIFSPNTTKDSIPGTPGNRKPMGKDYSCVPPSIQEKRVVDGNVEGKPAIIGKPETKASSVSQGRKAAIIANQPKGMAITT